MSAIEVRGLRVVVEGRALVDGIDLDVEEGTWTTVVGPNGSGKTTLIEAIAGLRRAEGAARVTGRDVRALSERARARLLAFVPQHPVVPPGISVRDYIGLGRTAHQGLLQATTLEGRGVVEDSISRIGLSELASRDLGTLSGGERQRAVLARALAQRAMVIVLDEPTTGLDVRHQVETLELLRREVVESGVTVLATLHDLTLAGLFGDRLALLSRGRLVLEAPARSVLRSRELRDAYEVDLRVLDVDGVDVVVPVVASPTAASQESSRRLDATAEGTARAAHEDCRDTRTDLGD
jgi:iron complex transport system ATP-binding protein